MTGSAFDRIASSWDDDPLKVERARVVVHEIRRRFVLPRSPRILEVGAGTGLVSQHLASLGGELVLMEPSAGMQRVIEKKVAAGLLPEHSRTWVEPLGERSPSGQRFDLVVSVMVMHHMPDVPTALSHMREYLADNGRLVIIDLETEDGSFHSAGFSGHHGFDCSNFGRLLESAGMTDIQIAGNIFAMEKDSQTYPLFMASGTAGARDSALPRDVTSPA